MGKVLYIVKKVLNVTVIYIERGCEIKQEISELGLMQVFDLGNFTERRRYYC